MGPAVLTTRLGEPDPSALLGLIDQYDDCSGSNCP